MTHFQSIVLDIIGVSYAVLLIISIAAVILVVAILRSIKNVVDKVENSAENLSETISAVGNKIRPVVASGLIKFILKKFNDKKKEA